MENQMCHDLRLMGRLHGGLGSENVVHVFPITNTITVANAGEHCPDPLAQT